MTHQIDVNVCRSGTFILWSSDFASYLEDYLIRNVVLGIINE